MRKNEKGAASIEATISLTIFVFVIMAIYLLINYCLVQAKVSYAINISVYASCDLFLVLFLVFCLQYHS